MAQSRTFRTGDMIFVKVGSEPEISIFAFPDSSSSATVYLELPGVDVEFHSGERAAGAIEPPEPRMTEVGRVIRIRGDAKALFRFDKAGPVLVRLPGRDILYTVTNVQSPRRVIRLMNDSLETVLRTARDVVIEIDPAVKQSIRSTLVIVGDNVTIRGVNPNVKSIVNIPAPQDAYFGLIVRGRNFVAENLHFTTNYTGTDRRGCPATPVSFSRGGQGEVRNCTADNTDKFVNCMQDHGGVRVIDCECSAKTRGQGVWGGGDNVHVERCTLRSRNEHPIRFGDDGLATYRASNVVIRGCTLIQSAGALKETLSIRKGDGPFLVEDTECRVGEKPGDLIRLGYGIRFGYDLDERQPTLGPVTFRNVRSINGWLHMKKSCIGGGPYTFENVAFSGTLKVTPPLQLNGAEATTTGCTSTSGAAVKP